MEFELVSTLKGWTICQVRRNAAGMVKSKQVVWGSNNSEDVATKAFNEKFSSGREAKGVSD